MNPLDISQMHEELKDIYSTDGNPNDFSLSPSFVSLDISNYVPKKHNKIDKKGRIYGKVVTCNVCNAKNITLINYNNQKICKKCKSKLEGK